MGIFYCKRPVTFRERAISYELLCNALTKWYGETAYFAHVFYRDDLTTSYISKVIRWKVCAKRVKGYEYVEFVMKLYPKNESRGRSFRSDVFFKNEITFYEHILPELLKFQNSKNVSQIFDNHLRLCFSFCNGKEDALCFGDELTEGFKNAKESLDVAHGKLVLRTLARFHGISFAFKDQNPEDFERIRNEITETYYSDKYWGWYKKLWSKICSIAKDAVEKEYPHTRYVKKINEFAVQSCYKELIKAVKATENGVILHGDCNTSNYLFKYIDERPVDIKMVDFQQTRYASPVLDVSSVFYNNNALLKDYDGLLKYYHGVLSSQIIELGSNPDLYTWNTFADDVKKYSFFGLACSFEAAAIKLTAKDVSDKELAGWEGNKILNIADVIEVKNLEGKERLELANNIIYCIDRGYI